MANFQAVHGVMHALERLLNDRMPPSLAAPPLSARAVLFGSKDLQSPPASNRLALYLHRLTVDPTVAGGWVRTAVGPTERHDPEVALRLHFLMIAFGDGAQAEMELMAWGVQEVLNLGGLDVDQLGGAGNEWRDAEVVQLATEDMSTEDLLRIWDALRTQYHVTVPFVARAVRVRSERSGELLPPVVTRVLVAQDGA